MPMSQEFTNQWFAIAAKENWDQIFPQLKPRKILEVGSYEGASTCYCIRTLSNLVDHLELHCVDTWEGGIEHKKGGAAEVNMQEIEQRFRRNIEIEIQNIQFPVAINIHKERSATALTKLIATGRSGFFDFIYIDGSHQAPDVLTDAILAFQLLRIGGVIAFDDYLWSEHAVLQRDPLRSPKIAIDAFTNIFFRKVSIVKAPLYQLYVTKVAD